MNMDDLKKMGHSQSNEHKQEPVPQKWWQDSFYRKIILALVILCAISTFVGIAFSFYVVHSTNEQIDRMDKQEKDMMNMLKQIKL